MKTVFEVRVRRNGQVTLPRELRKRAQLEVGTTLTLHDLGNCVLLLNASSASVSESADRLAQQWRESGVSLEDLLTELRQVRKERDAQDS